MDLNKHVKAKLQHKIALQNLTCKLIFMEYKSEYSNVKFALEVKGIASLFHLKSNLENVQSTTLLWPMVMPFARIQTTEV
jgi:hypothetical protein